MANEPNKELSCTRGNPLTEDEISAVLDQEATSEIHAHLEVCAHCQQLVATARTAEQGIRKVLHPSSEAIGEYHLGLLPPSETEVIRSHLVMCEKCQRELQTLNEFMQTSDGIPSVAEQATTTPTQVATPTEGNAGIIRMVVRPLAKAAGVRGADPRELFRVMAEAQDIKLSLLWNKQQRELSMFITALQTMELKDILVLCDQAGNVSVRATDSMGHLKFRVLNPGALNIIVMLPNGKRMLLEGVQLPV
jgi:hypothetical protein